MSDLPPCDPAVFKDGATFLMIPPAPEGLCSANMEKHVREVNALCGDAATVDWHRAAGYAVIKYIGKESTVSTAWRHLNDAYHEMLRAQNEGIQGGAAHG